MVPPKKYYLETNALYSIRKIDTNHLVHSFTSGLAIFELISGLKSDNFSKRKTIINLIRTSKLQVDWTMPEHLLFSSFDALDEFSFTDHRQDALVRLLKVISTSNSIDDVRAADVNEGEKMGLDYFINLDRKYNLNFVTATEAGNRDLKGSFEVPNPEPVILNEKIYDLNSHKDMEHLFTAEPSLNRAFSILSFAGVFLTKEVVSAGISEEAMYNSYNGYVDKFMEVYAARTSHYTIQRATKA